MLIQNNITHQFEAPLFYVGVGKLGSMYGELNSVNSMGSDRDSNLREDTVQFSKFEVLNGNGCIDYKLHNT